MWSARDVQFRGDEHAVFVKQAQQATSSSFICRVRMPPAGRITEGDAEFPFDLAAVGSRNLQRQPFTLQQNGACYRRGRFVGRVAYAMSAKGSIERLTLYADVGKPA
jgi:hypothetical protein